MFNTLTRLDGEELILGVEVVDAVWAEKHPILPSTNGLRLLGFGSSSSSAVSTSCSSSLTSTPCALSLSFSFWISPFIFLFSCCTFQLVLLSGASSVDAQ